MRLWREMFRLGGLEVSSHLREAYGSAITMTLSTDIRVYADDWIYNIYTVVAKHYKFMIW